eukprot:Nk52_evm55s164 gene=Nk52_evmTU55s164
MGESKSDIDIRRERSALISSKLGEYMLKGYRMLNAYCDDCGTVLLAEKGTGEKQCIACREFPFCSPKKEEVTPVKTSTEDTSFVIKPEPANARTTTTQSYEALKESAGSAVAKAFANVLGGDSANIVSGKSGNSETGREVEAIIKRKLTDSVKRLERCPDVSESIQYCLLIQELAKTLQAVQSLK